MTRSSIPRANAVRNRETSPWFHHGYHQHQRQLLLLHRDDPAGCHARHRPPHCAPPSREDRFVHLEFFGAQRGSARAWAKGRHPRSQVNMRPSGGFSADMFNFANPPTCIKIWADMVAYDRQHRQQRGARALLLLLLRPPRRQEFRDGSRRDHGQIRQPASRWCSASRRRFPAPWRGYDVPRQHAHRRRKAAYYRDLLATNKRHIKRDCQFFLTSPFPICANDA